jgi:GntR family transcriptional regulator
MLHDLLMPAQESRLPLHGQLREHLRAQILDGTFPAEAQLPSESELGAQFKVSRITVRQALSDLQHEGLIFKIPGKGAFVRKPRAFQQLHELEGFASALARSGHTVRNRVTSVGKVPASLRVAARLDVPASELVCRIERVRLVDGEPVSFEITHLPAAVGDRLRHADLEGRDIFALLEDDHGLSLGHADLQIGAIPADEALAAQLGTAESTALLHIERLTHAASGEPIDFEDLFFRGDAFQYRLRLVRHEGRAHA